MKHITPILIAFLHAIGDNIMFTGVLHEYKKRNPDLSIHLLLMDDGSDIIWKGNPDVTATHKYFHTQPRFWNTLMYYGHDQRAVYDNILPMLIDKKSKYETFKLVTVQTWPEIVYHLTGTYGKHKVCRMAEEMGLPAIKYPYRMFPTEKDMYDAQRIVKKLPKDFALVHPFSRHCKKNMSDELIEKVLKDLKDRGLSPIVIGGNADRVVSSHMLYGLPLHVLLEVMRSAKQYVGTDSSPAHLAGLANIPRITVYSPKLKPSRYEPVSVKSAIVLKKL